MAAARIIDTTRHPLRSARDELTARLGFRALLHRTATSLSDPAELLWGDDVAVISRGVRRARVRTADGRIGYVVHEHVVDRRFVNPPPGQDFTTPLWRNPDGSESEDLIYDLLWGDEVQVVHGPAVNGRVRVFARGWRGWIDAMQLSDRPLLELYFVDVGQGDGVLIRTPDDRHILIDGGYSRGKQPLGKSAADFVDWKFFEDYRKPRITLDAMIASHCDADHYGGLWDLLSDDASARNELDSAGCDIAAFHHAGVSWWRDNGRRGLGPKQSGFLTRLLGDRASLVAAVQPGASPELQGEWRQFLAHVAASPARVERLGIDTGDTTTRYVPGFAPADGTATLRVLSPVVHPLPSGPAVRSLGNDAQNTNGHSITLLLKYGRATILLTGDLNKKAQHALLQEYAGRTDVFACDVAKACHHGSEDVSWRFLQAVNAAATIISSGDNEGHAHPRPAIVAASALTGFTALDQARDELITPLVYATEIERSVAHGRVVRVDTARYPHLESVIDLRVYARSPADLDTEYRTDAYAKRNARSRVHFTVTSAGALRPTPKDRSLFGSYVVSGIIYGLVNVRTDGTTIVCATRNETKNGWNVKSFTSRFPAPTG